MQPIVKSAGAVLLVAFTVMVSASAIADPVLNPSTNAMVATSVGDYVAAEQARIAAEEARIAAEEAARLARAKDMSGIGPSAYTGDYYVASSDATRRCIVRKESGGNYAIVSGNGMYHGAYQFSQPTANSAAVKMGRPDLVGVPPEQWDRYEQDMAFWVTWNHGAGRGNWPTARGC